MDQRICDWLPIIAKIKSGGGGLKSSASKILYKTKAIWTQIQYHPSGIMHENNAENKTTKQLWPNKKKSE